MKKNLLLFILAIAFLSVNGQSTKIPYVIEARMHTGMNLPFYEALGYLIKDDIYAFDLSIGLPAYGNNYWEKLYRNPNQGFGISTWSLGNNDVFGRAYALYTYLNIPFYRRKDKFSFNYQFSLGGAYLSKRFDVYSDHLNRAIGSHANIYVRVGVDGRIKLSPFSELVIEAGGTHFSNGKTKSPNYGINAGTVSLGFNHLFNPGVLATEEPVIPEIENRYVQSVIYFAGAKVYDNLNGQKYLVTSVLYSIERQVSLKRRFGIGTILTYDGSMSEELAGSDGLPEKDFIKLLRLGLHATYSVQYKRLVGGLQFGHYLYSKYNVITPFYNRFSVQYLFSGHITGCAAIKSHMGKADCLEWGIGYSW